MLCHTIAELHCVVWEQREDHRDTAVCSIPLISLSVAFKNGQMTDLSVKVLKSHCLLQ